MPDSNSPLRRSKGRPPSIDRIAALDAAVLTFWELGYDGASLTDLTKAMKLSRPSLYAGFGDKADLFLAALERYGQTIGSQAMVAFEEIDRIEDAVRAFLESSVRANTEPGRPAGCLFACCAGTVASCDPQVRTLLHDVMEFSELRLRKRFATEATEGHVSTTPTPDARAALLIDFMSAQAVRARAGESRNQLLAGVEARLNAVLASE